MSARGRWASYEEVRAWARREGIASHSAWIRTPRPAGIPSHPEMVFCEQWPGWAEFLARSANLVSFEEAQDWGRAQGLRNGEDWKRSVRPIGIPLEPFKVYGERWPGWREFLGTAWMSFEDARAWAREQKLSNRTLWADLSRSGKLPDVIPSNPNLTYKNKGWTTWGDFLGTGNVSVRLMRHVSYQNAQKWVRSHPDVFNRKSWAQATKPIGFPQNPEVAYKDHGWQGWSEFIGCSTPRISHEHLLPKIFQTYPSLMEMRQFCLDHHISNTSQWIDHYCRRELPPGYPRLPSKHPDYVDWSTFMGRERQRGSSMIERIVAFEIGTFLRLDESIHRVPFGDGKFKRADMVFPDIQLLVEYDGARWHRDSYDKDLFETRLLQKSGWSVVRVREAPLSLITHRMDITVPSRGRPFNTTALVINHLSNLGFLGIEGAQIAQSYIDHGKLRSTGKNIASMHWVTFTEARNFAQSLGLKSRKEWLSFTKRPDFPRNIPITPECVYSDSFTTYTDFLATGYKPKVFANYEEARKWSLQQRATNQREWKCLNRPPWIPSSPWRTYDGKGWTNWHDFLGKSIA